ncbi:MAG: hypothetical protein ACC682_14555 [Gemmatimonadota bacterium]
MSSAAFFGSFTLLLGAALQGKPPPTSGNLMTIFLGLTASSLVVVVVVAAIVRGLRNFWYSRSGPRSGGDRNPSEASYGAGAEHADGPDPRRSGEFR